MKEKRFDKNASLVMKGIAILMMLFHHLYRNGLDIYQEYSVSYFPMPEMNVHNIADVCKICVALYAFISGFGLYLNCKKEMKSAGRWVLVREKKLLAPFWVVVVLCWIICQTADGRTGEIYFSDGNSYSGIAYMVVEFFGGAALFGTPTMVLEWWYMSAAVVFVILVPFVVSMEDRLVPVLLTVVALPRVLGVGYQGACGIYSFLFAFLLGVLCARYDLVNRWMNIGESVWRKRCRFVFELAGILLGYKFYRKIPVGIFWEYHFGLYPLLVIFFSVEFIAYVPWVRESLAFLGKHSTNMYLIHSLFLYLYWTEWIYGMPHFLISYAVLIGISLCAAMLIDLLTDQLSKFLRRFQDVYDGRPGKY